MRISRIVVGMVAVGFALSSAPQQQTPQNASTKPNAYEVVSIKPSKPGSPGSSEILPNGFRDTETTIGDVMR
ncbi:MAG TPA: hypothetical protein VGI45_11205, partial [Terracidiphilus sp.]